MPGLGGFGRALVGWLKPEDEYAPSVTPFAAAKPVAPANLTEALRQQRQQRQLNPGLGRKILGGVGGALGLNSTGATGLRGGYQTVLDRRGRRADYQAEQEQHRRIEDFAGQLDPHAAALFRLNPEAFSRSYSERYGRPEKVAPGEALFAPGQNGDYRAVGGVNKPFFEGDSLFEQDPVANETRFQGQRRPSFAEETDAFEASSQDELGRGKLGLEQQRLALDGQRLALDASRASEVNASAEGQLRREYHSRAAKPLAVMKAYSTLRRLSADETGTSDIAFVYTFMKTLDPTSVVREGEFATAENAGGVPSRVAGLYNKLLRGERLAPSTRAEFMGTAEALYADAAEQLSQEQQFYGNVAAQYGYSPNRIFDPSADYLAELEAGPAQPAAGQRKTAQRRADQLAARARELERGANPYFGDFRHR